MNSFGGGKLDPCALIMSHLTEHHNFVTIQIEA